MICGDARRPEYVYIEFIWRRRKCFTSIVFLWIRYVGLIGFGVSASYLLQEQKDDTLCERYLQMQGIFSSVIIATVDVVLVYRIWILYGKSRFILYALSSVVFGWFKVINLYFPCLIYEKPNLL
ncbi:hypothetical protein BDQ17DRAFT_1335414 [Cyathus striatus]|nr:hypothetical protein BDQ17DRAFT_1335414 [Cyathus striatus]